jgi:hypothetical protein
VVVQTCNSKLYQEAEPQRITFPAQPQAKSLRDSIQMGRKAGHGGICLSFQCLRKLKIRGWWSRLAWAKKQDSISRIPK